MTLQTDGSSHGAAYSDLTLHRMLSEMSCVSAQLEESVQASLVLKRVQFLAYELRSQTPISATPSESCAILNEFFFRTKGFRSVPNAGDLADPTPVFLLHRVLQTRTGAPVVLSLIYSFLACQIGLKLEFVDLRPTCFLKFLENGASHFIDLSRQGRILESDDLLESLHSRFNLRQIPAPALLDRVSSERFMTDYLLALKAALVTRGEPAALLIVQNSLMLHDPGNLHLLAERALLQRRLGHFKSALSDLKRYFAFIERRVAPPEIVRVHDELLAHVERQIAPQA